MTRSGTGGRTNARTVRPPSADLGGGGLGLEQQGSLAARHREIDVREDPRVEQSAVQLASRIVDFVTLAQCVQAVALAGMHALARAQVYRAPGTREATAATRLGRSVDARELSVEERDVERRVVDHELGTVDEREQLLGDLARSAACARDPCA